LDDVKIDNAEIVTEKVDSDAGLMIHTAD